MPEADRSRGSIRRLFPTRNPHVRTVLRTVEKILDNDANILLLGESGVGKDFLAEAIHRSGIRRLQPFVRIDCASIPEELFESELFGYEKGTFTDAVDRKPGKLEMAQRGTLYFDEVGTLAPHLQAKLLRVIQENRFSRLGGSRNIDLDVRILSSSNLPLEQLLETGALRRDLYYRLNVVSLALPPLRERREDVPILARAFLRDAAKRYKKRITGFAPETLALLQSHSWPGNLRELRNVIDRAVILETGSAVTPESLPLETFVSASDLVSRAAERKMTLDDLEREYIREILRQTRSNYSKAAEILGINRKTLLEKRRRYRLD